MYQILRKDCLLNFTINRFFKNINSPKCYILISITHNIFWQFRHQAFHYASTRYVLQKFMTMDMLIISIIVLFMSSVEWKWQWFLLSVIESRYFYDSERFQMEWARTAVGSAQKKVVHCWDKSASSIADISASASAFSIVKVLAWSFQKVSGPDHKCRWATGLVSANVRCQIGLF